MKNLRNRLLLRTPPVSPNQEEDCSGGVKKRRRENVIDDDDEQEPERAFVDAARWGNLQVLRRLMQHDNNNNNNESSSEEEDQQQESSEEDVSDCERRRKRPRRRVVGTVDATSPDWFGKTALHRACYYGHMEVLKFLLEKAANVNAKDQLGSTPLHEAIDGKQSVQLVHLLLSHGADVNAKNKYGQTPLHTATRLARLDLMECLLKDGKANVNAMDEEGITPLRWVIEQQEEDYHYQQSPHQAASSGVHSRSRRRQATTASLLRALLDARANVNVSVYSGGRKQPALQWLIRSNHIDLVDRLLASRLGNNKDCDQEQHADDEDNEELELELDAVDSDGMTALHVAIQQDQVGLVRQMLDLHDAQPDEWPRLLEAREYIREESPLDLAAQRGHVDIVARLLQMTGGDEGGGEGSEAPGAVPNQ